MKPRRGRLYRVGKVLALTLLFLALLLLFDPGGLTPDSPLTLHPKVRTLAVLQEQPPSIPVVGTSQDFDGDGSIDIVRSDTDPDSAWSGNGPPQTVLSVESGRTGERLVECVVKNFATANWYGDFDENGTMDVVFELEGEWHVFGFTGDLVRQQSGRD